MSNTQLLPRTTPLRPKGYDPSDYGLMMVMANKKTHKRFLRKHRLGKFKKNRSK